jgi:hypothetical protein
VANTIEVVIAECQQMLRERGASATHLARLGRELYYATPKQIPDITTHLRQLSPAELVEYVDQQRRPSLDDQYATNPDSVRRPGVPRGEVIEFADSDSTAFSGATRKIAVYVPAQYSADKPACVYVALDGLTLALPTVFDNLIDRLEISITIAVGIEPGVVQSAQPPRNPRLNRSLEFDAMDGSLGRYLLDEVFSKVERLITAKGAPIRLSQDPNDRAAGGTSTGGIGAFTLCVGASLRFSASFHGTWYIRCDAWRRSLCDVGAQN